MTEAEVVTFAFCISALLWGVYFFIRLANAGEREWARYQQEQRFAALGQMFDDLIDAMRQIGVAASKVTVEMQKFGQAFR